MAMGKVSSHCFFVLLCAVFSCFHTTSCGAYSLTKQCSTKLAKAFVSVWLSVGGAEEWRNLQRTPGELWQLDEHQPERSHLHIQGEWQLDLSVNVLIFLVSLNVNSSCFCDCPGTFNASPYCVCCGAKYRHAIIGLLKQMFWQSMVPFGWNPKRAVDQFLACFLFVMNSIFGRIMSREEKL